MLQGGFPAAIFLRKMDEMLLFRAGGPAASAIDLEARREKGCQAWGALLSFDSKNRPLERTLSYLPVNMDVRNRKCLVVGGGAVGERKVCGLLECGARVFLVSRTRTAGLRRLSDEGLIDYLGPEFEPDHLEGVRLVFAATNDRELNTRVYREAERRGIWVNVADQPDLCSFIVPASVRRGDLAISISTGGRSPAMAAHIRAGLERQFGPEYGRFLDLMGRIRARVLAEGGASDDNKKVFQRLVESDLLAALNEGCPERINGILTGILGPSYTLESLGMGVGSEAGA